jgi:hypothetical protein
MHYGQNAGTNPVMLDQTPTFSPSKSALVGGTSVLSASWPIGPRPTPAVSVSWNRDSDAVQKVQKSDHELVFDHVVALRMLAANYVMHLDEAWRSGMFKQLGNLVDADEWDFSDELPSPASFKTFLRMIIHNQVKLRPGLGATSDGNIVAAWTTGRDRLTVECMPNDDVRWVVTRYLDGVRKVSSANTAPVDQLRALLAPLKPEVWFGDAN